jgi:hypothetical protein
MYLCVIDCTLSQPICRQAGMAWAGTADACTQWGASSSLLAAKLPVLPALAAHLSSSPTMCSSSTTRALISVRLSSSSMRFTSALAFSMVHTMAPGGRGQGGG